MYNVYEQQKPTPTGEKAKFRNDEGKVQLVEWYTANFRFVGRAASFDDARLLTKHPIMEAMQ